MVSFLKKLSLNWTINRRVKEEVQLQFLKRLCHLLSMGYSILEALDVMKWDHHFTSISEKLIHYLKKGKRIDQVFEKANFHETIIVFLYFVTINGDLMLSLKKCIEMFENRLEYVKKFKKIIRYPIVLSLFFTILLLFLQQSVLPSFIELFSMNQDSSKIVLFTLVFIDFIIVSFMVILLLTMIIYLCWWRIKHHLSIESKIKLYQKVPIYRVFLTMQTSYYFATQFSMYLRAGLSIKDTLQSIANQNKLPIISFYTNLMIEQLSKGQKVDHLLLGLPFIEKQIGYIFQKNDDTDSLERDLAAYSDYVREKLERKMMQFIQLVQPSFFILLAVFIVFVYVTLMWPMFQVINSV